jgi:dTMP kinase
VEGAGKTSRCRKLAGTLEEAGVPTVHTREPGGSQVAERIRDLLLDPGLRMGALTELMLYLAARAGNVSSVVRPALEQGRTVLCERFSDATIAYQVHGRGLPEKPVRSADRLATGGLVPDLTILLDLDPEEGFRRLDRQERELDRIEGEALEFHRRVREGYLELAGKDTRFFTVDASLPAPEQDELILGRVMALLEEHRKERQGI